MGLRIGLRGYFVVQPALFFEPGPFPGLPGPAVGPEGPKIGQKPGAGFIILSPLRSAQPFGAAPFYGHPTAEGPPPGLEGLVDRVLEAQLIVAVGALL